MRRSRLWMTLVLALVAAGCGAPVALLAIGPGESACFLSFIEGELVTDPAHGTSIVEAAGHRWPVLWPDGYTGRRSGLEVEVLDASGRVVARTGARYHIGGGYYGEAPRAWLACPSIVYALGAP